MAQIAFRSVPQDLVFRFTAEDLTEFAGRNQGPNIPLQVAPKAFAPSGLSRASLKSIPAIQQRLPDGFGFGFVRQASNFAGQPLYFGVLDMKSHLRNLPVLYHSV